MKRYLLFLFLSFIFINLKAQDSVMFNYWTGGTAFVLPKHRFELSILDESHYGLSDRFEISSHLIKSLLMPNLKIKISWGSYNGFYFASKHGLFYPSPFMRTVAREGIGGLISPEFNIPEMVSINNQIIVSCSPLKNTILSAYTGFNFALKSGELDERTTIDLPYIYPRLAVFYNRPEIVAGLDFRGNFTRCFGLKYNIDNFLFLNTSENYFLENTLVLTYTSKKQKTRIELGSKLSYGKYLWGEQWHLLPMLSFAFKL